MPGFYKGLPGFIFALQGGPGKIFYGIIIYLILKYKNIENIDTCYCLLIYLFIVDNKKGLDLFLFILNIYYNKDISYLKI